MDERSITSLLEAHSYAGGLRYTPFGADGPRPAWVPPPDSVGWRDEFDLGPDEAVVEFSQRAHAGNTVTWVAVYRRSVDARFGDRNNHAGIGVWLLGARIADARSLLSSLNGFAVALGANPEPQLLAGKVAEFASRRFLHSYLVPVAELPPDWAGAPAAGSALPETAMSVVLAPDFDAGLVSLAEAVTRCSLSWDGSKLTPRTLIRVTSLPAALEQTGFIPLPAAGTFLADVIERIPISFAASRKALQDAKTALDQDRGRLESEIRGLEQRWDAERRQTETLDGLPPTLEGIAKRLNALSKQHAELQSEIKNLAPRLRTEVQEPPRITIRPPHRPVYRHEAPAAAEDEWAWVSYAIWGSLIVLMIAAIGVAIYRLV